MAVKVKALEWEAGERNAPDIEEMDDGV